MITRRALLLSLAAVALTACGEEADASKPPDLKLGKDTCHRCGMMISEERHAAALVDKKGDAQLFDDTGEMLMTAQEEGVNDRHVWVHDFDSGSTWIDGTKAFYVASKNVMTPMGTGVVAFAERRKAEVLATAQAGTTMDWNEMLTKWKGAPGMMGFGRH